MLYLAVVCLTMFLLPLGSVAAEHTFRPETPLILLAGKWFVFWGVGVRLVLAGARQVMQPAFTAREIVHIESSEALPLVRELGIANFATGVVGLASLLASSFVLPVAISAAIFYGVAGIRHVAERGRSRNETVALVSDLWMFAVLAAFAGASILTSR